MNSAQLTILDEIHARLLNITETNGYDWEVQENTVQRARLLPFKNGDLPAINYWPVNDVLEEKTYEYDTRELNISVEGYTKTRDEPFTDVAIKLGDDMILSLFRSIDAPLTTDEESPALGGLVEAVLVDSITPMIGEGESPWCGVLVEIRVRYNVAVGDFRTIVKY